MPPQRHYLRLRHHMVIMDGAKRVFNKKVFLYKKPLRLKKLDERGFKEYKVYYPIKKYQNGKTVVHLSIREGRRANNISEPQYFLCGPLKDVEFMKGVVSACEQNGQRNLKMSFSRIVPPPPPPPPTVRKVHHPPKIPLLSKPPMIFGTNGISNLPRMGHFNPTPQFDFFPKSQPNQNHKNFSKPNTSQILSTERNDRFVTQYFEHQKKRKRKKKKGSSLQLVFPMNGRNEGGEYRHIYFKLSKRDYFNRLLHEPRITCHFGDFQGSIHSIVPSDTSLEWLKNNHSKAFERCENSQFIAVVLTPETNFQGKVSVVISFNSTFSLRLRSCFEYTGREQEDQIIEDYSEFLLPPMENDDIILHNNNNNNDDDDDDDLDDEFDTFSTSANVISNNHHHNVFDDEEEEDILLEEEEIEIEEDNTESLSSSSCPPPPPPPGSYDFFNCTPLFFAAAQNNLNLVRYHVEKQGMNVDQLDVRGYSCIDVSRHFRHEEVLRYLISKSRYSSSLSFQYRQYQNHHNHNQQKQQNQQQQQQQQYQQQQQQHQQQQQQQYQQQIQTQKVEIEEEEEEEEEVELLSTIGGFDHFPGLFDGPASSSSIATTTRTKMISNSSSSSSSSGEEEQPLLKRRKLVLDDDNNRKQQYRFKLRIPQKYDTINKQTLMREEEERRRIQRLKRVEMKKKKKRLKVLPHSVENRTTTTSTTTRRRRGSGIYYPDNPLFGVVNMFSNFSCDRDVL